MYVVLQRIGSVVTYVGEWQKNVTYFYRKVQICGIFDSLVEDMIRLLEQAFPTLKLN